MTLIPESITDRTKEILAQYPESAKSADISDHYLQFILSLPIEPRDWLKTLTPEERIEEEEERQSIFFEPNLPRPDLFRPTPTDNIYKQSEHSDKWACHDCRVTGDIWLMHKHICSLSKNKKKRDQLVLSQNGNNIKTSMTDVRKNSNMYEYNDS